jgi:hypothetical protein
MDLTEPAKVGAETLEGLGQTLAKRVALEEFFIDFFAALAPGCAFLVLLILAYSTPLAALADVLAAYTAVGGATGVVRPLVAQQLSGLATASAAAWIALSVVFLLLSYVVGLLLYRLDPEEPDKASWRTLSKLIDKAEHEHRLAATSEPECRYPYPHMKEYLARRGMDHLDRFVPVRMNGGDQRGSKSHVHALKIRLRYFYPERVGQLIRIESHIRLNASLWHAARVLRGLAICAAVLALAPAVAFALQPAATMWPLPLYLLLPVVDPVVVLILSIVCMKAVQRSLHYQRVRELVVLYELAYVAFRNSMALLEPPFGVPTEGAPRLDGAARPPQTLHASPT